MDALDLLKHKLLAALEGISAVKVETVAIVPDPSRPGAYAVRAYYGHQVHDDYELTGYFDQSSHWISRHLEQTTFTGWPPFVNVPKVS